MSNTENVSPAPENEANTDVLATMYEHAGEASLVGAFLRGSKATQSAILSKYRFDPLPDALLEMALESRENEVLWSLSQRHDLPSEAIDSLIGRRSPLVQRSLASNPRMSSAQLARLLPGDEFVRQRVFDHPNASRTLRKQIITARDSTGAPLPRANSLDEELLEPMYALWMTESPTAQGRVQALNHLPVLPAAYQWHLAWKVIEGVIPLPAALGARGWLSPLHAALREAVTVLATGGHESAMDALSSTLRSLGEPPVSAEVEARLLPDVEEAKALASDEPLDWPSLARLLRSGEMSIHAVRYLLQRDDRTAAFTSAALVFHGDDLGVLRLCELNDIRKAAAISSFAPSERARLLRLVINSPELPYPLLDMVARFPIRDVLEVLQSSESTLADHQLRRLGSELSEVLEDSAQGWGDFEAARQKRRNITFAGALGVAGERFEDVD